MKRIFNRYKCSIDADLHEEFIKKYNFKNINELVDYVVDDFKLENKKYIGNIINNIQYEEIIKNKSINLIGDLENDLNDFKITDLLYVILTKNLPKPVYNRSLCLYYKNEHGLTPGIVDEYEFKLHCSIIEKLISNSLLKNFNDMKIICRHSSPEYIDELTCEKITQEVGSKRFEIITSLYSNPIFYFNGTLNFNHFKTRAILTPQCYEINTCPSELSYEKYNYPGFDFTIDDKIKDVYRWKDGTVSEVKQRFYNRESNYNIEQKLQDFIKCVLKLDDNPLFL